MLRVKIKLDHVCETIGALQFVGKSLGPSNIRYRYASMVHLIHIKHQTFVVIIFRHCICNWVICEHIVHTETK